MYMFLHQVFNKNKDLSKLYHKNMIPLYIRHNKKALMPFLQATDQYDTFQTAQLCGEFQMFKE